MRVVLAAEEAAGLQALRMVAESEEHELVAVMTSTPGPASAAERLGVPVWDAGVVRNPALGSGLAEAKTDLLLNVHSLYVIHPEVLEAPSVGSFNLHPGPLPRYAGLNAPSWAIYNGESRHACTLHWMTAEIDAGLIAYEAWFDLTPADTGLTASAKGVKHGMPLVGRLLADAPASIPAAEQEGERRYYGRDAPHDGRLPWTLPARTVDALVRASDFGPFPSPWGRPVATLDGSEVEFLRTALTGRPADADAGSVGENGHVAAADEWVAVERVRIDGETVAGRDVLPVGTRLA